MPSRSRSCSTTFVSPESSCSPGPSPLSRWPPPCTRHGSPSPTPARPAPRRCPTGPPMTPPTGPPWAWVCPAASSTTRRGPNDASGRACSDRLSEGQIEGGHGDHLVRVAAEHEPAGHGGVGGGAEPLHVVVLRPVQGAHSVDPEGHRRSTQKRHRVT